MEKPNFDKNNHNTNSIYTLAQNDDPSPGKQVQRFEIMTPQENAQDKKQRYLAYFLSTLTLILVAFSLILFFYFKTDGTIPVILAILSGLPASYYCYRQHKKPEV